MPLVVTGILLNCKIEQGDWSRFAYPVQRSYGISVDEWSDQPLVPAQFLTFGKGLMHLADKNVRRHVDLLSDLRLWPHLLLKTPGPPGSLGPFRIWIS